MTLQDVIENRHEAATIDQMIVVTRIQELTREGADLTEQLHAIHKRMSEIQLICKELYGVLTDMPGDDTAHIVPAQDADLSYGPVDVEV